MSDEAHGPAEPEPYEASRERAVPVSAGARAVRGGVIALTDPVVAILLLAAFFDGISDNWVHAALLTAVAVALGVDAVRRRWGVAGAGRFGEPLFSQSTTSSDEARVARRFLLGLGAGLLALVYAVIGGSFVRYTWPITILIVVPAAAVVAVGWRGPLHRREIPGPLDPAGAGWWAAVFVAGGLWELTTLLLQPSLKTDSYAHPTISVLTASLLGSHGGRSVALLVWLGLGWLLLDR